MDSNDVHNDYWYVQKHQIDVINGQQVPGTYADKNPCCQVGISNDFFVYMPQYDHPYISLKYEQLINIC